MQKKVGRRGFVAGALATGLVAATATSAQALTYDPSYGTVNLNSFGDPTAFKSFAAFNDPSVMQDIVYKNGGTFFATQAPKGSNGSTTPYASTVINRLSYSTGQTLDTMKLVDGGHGLGFEIEYASDGTTWVWMTWAGASSASGNRENDFVRFPYKSGTYTRAQVSGLQVLPVQDGPEAVYHFDWAKDWAVERHFEFDGSGETYKRRKISELRSGVNQVYNQMKLPTNPPTVQGFATLNDTLFRYNGKAFDNNTMVSGDPVVLEQYDWNSGQRVATRTLYLSRTGTNPNTWRDGHFEPEGMSVFRESTGYGSLIVGDTTGLSGNHAYHVSKFSNIGAQ